jgi:hypothetical protein
MPKTGSIETDDHQMYSTVGHFCRRISLAFCSPIDLPCRVLPAPSRFAMTISTGACRDIYALKFHVGIGVMGSVQIVHRCSLFMFDLIIGIMQDKEMFVFRIFNKERWGRRAPWVILSSPIMGLMMYFT